MGKRDNKHVLSLENPSLDRKPKSFKTESKNKSMF